MTEGLGAADGQIELVDDALEALAALGGADIDAAKLGTRLARTLETIADGLYVFDREWRFRYLNREAERMLRRPRSELLGRVVWDEFPEAVGGIFDTEYHRAVESGEAVAFETHDAPLDVWVVVRAHPTDLGLVAYFLDVSAKHEAEAAVAASERRFRSLFDKAGDALLVADRTGRYVEVNHAAAEMLGLPRASLIGRSLSDFVVQISGSEDTEAAWARFVLSGEVPGHGAAERGEVRLRRSDGTIRVAEFAAVANVSPGLHLAILRDVTERHRYAEMAERRARILDAMRRLAPSERPSETADAICAEIVGAGTFSHAAILAFDEDGGMTILAARSSDGTDELPAHALHRGDSASLRERAAHGPWLGDWIGSDDARPPAAPRSEAASVFAPIESGDQVLGVLAAGGMEPVSDHATALMAVNEFSALASSLLGPGMRRRRELSITRRGIADVIAGRRFHPVYQSIVEMETGAIVGYEALTRFADGVAPDVVFRAATEAGLGQELEFATLEAAFDQAPPLNGRFLDLNVSPAMIIARDPLLGLLRRTGRQVILEITEHAKVDDYVALRQALIQLGEDVRFAVDDAGAGYASLRHILELSPTHVKLDRGLVSQVDADPARQALIAGLVHFAGRVGLTLIAEGVETEAQRQTLLHLSVRLGQGHLFGRPARGPGPDASGS